MLNFKESLKKAKVKPKKVSSLSAMSGDSVEMMGPHKITKCLGDNILPGCKKETPGCVKITYEDFSNYCFFSHTDKVSSLIKDFFKYVTAGHLDLQLFE